MKNTIRILIALGLILTAFVAYAGGPVYVRPYVRSDGTLVQGHYRSAPDGSRWNNWSTRGNMNPYTGEAGDKSPYRSLMPSYDTPLNPPGVINRDTHY